MKRHGNICRLVNSLWLARARPDYVRFVRALASCADTQERYLLRLLRRNEKSLFGREHGFRSIQTVEAFQNQIPVTDYKGYSPYVQRIAEGERSVLTTDPVRLFEPTSGTSSGEKLIPYTAELQLEFQRGINPWLVSLHAIDPQILRGRAYWSISPSQGSERRCHGRIPVGFDNDWSYLGPLGKLLYSRVAVLPLGTAIAHDTATFRATTLAGLVSASDLSLISIWSPSFLRLMLDWYRANHADVLDLLSSSPRNIQRVSFLRSLGVDGNIFQHIWPELRVVSCWTDSSSQQEAERLTTLLPHAQVQGKGLISTEAFVSFPLLPDQDPALAIRSHFFEFEDSDGQILLSHELEPGHEYSVIVTTGGGLYRYRTGDRVLATGFIESVPTMRFVGRNGIVSDRYGEKLNASHVGATIKAALNGLEVSFAMLAPDRLNGSHSYTLYIHSQEKPPADMPQRLDQLLQRNPHYQYCRKLGQLYPARVFSVAGDPAGIFEDVSVASGIRRGNVKLTPLSRQDGWSQQFEGRYI